MDVRFVPTGLDDLQQAVRQHYAALPSRIDSFLEDHILASAHYRIELDGEDAGFTSVHEGRLVTSFALNEPFRRRGQAVFRRVRRLEQVQSAFVPTCDEFFLAHALDDYRQLARQAYFFMLPGSGIPAPPDGYSLRLAFPADAALIRLESGDFFSDIPAPHTEREELFVTQWDGEPVGFGVLVKSLIYNDVVSIGMFTIERFRQRGVGTATISLLIARCRNLGLRPVAGCWYYNHRSKQTLERAGMNASTRLLKVDF